MRVARLSILVGKFCVAFALAHSLPSFLCLASSLHALCRKKSFGSPVDPKSCLGELIKGKTFLHGRDRSGNAVLYHFVRNQDPNTRGMN